MGRRINNFEQRKLYAESMGRCMNPDCQEELFKDNGDIIEKAHIIPFCDTEDNSFENLIVLCPNCHTNFDKNLAFSLDEVRMWKQIRKQKLNSIFSKEYATFNDLSDNVTPLLLENNTIYKNYYLGDKKELWDHFECKISANNRKLKKILENNIKLIQSHNNKDYSNLELVYLFITHIDEFEATRLKKEKIRQALFPEEIYSMFGISPVRSSLLPSVEALEAFITKLQSEGKFISISIGNDNPYIMLNKEGTSFKIYLDDIPRLRQFYFNYNCAKSAKVRLESLNFALNHMRSKNVIFKFLNYNNLREVLVNNIKIIFIYEYCLSKVTLMQLSPEANSVIVNLHNWNGSCCISREAYDFSKIINVDL
ncbi:MAG: HNH endonuclease, partial [Clostridiales bacterium]|nr:HNH endonuclease [Clostridiales bacterium]